MSGWRYRCPNGHTNWYKRTGTEGLIGQHCDHEYYCDTCKTGFNELYDAKRDRLTDSIA